MTNDTRTQLNLAALIIGAVLGLIAAAMLSGCSTIRTLPGIGAALTPAWDEATLSSNWAGDNARLRMMNVLSPHMSQATFEDRVNWMKARGVNTAHVFVGNIGDGEYSGYSIYGRTCSWHVDTAMAQTMRDRIRSLRGEGLAVVVWLLSDDSSAFNRAVAADFARYLRDLESEGLLAYASTVVVGLEVDEYYSSAQVAALVEAVRAVYHGKVGVHQTSGRQDYAPLADIFFGQVKPETSLAGIAAAVAKFKASGKPVNLFECRRQEDRAACQAAIQAGAFAVGNW